MDKFTLKTLPDVHKGIQQASQHKTKDFSSDVRP